jgi:hypothetical protein
LSGDYLTTIFDAYPDAVQSFRVIQRKDDSILVEYVPGHNQEYQCVVKKAGGSCKTPRDVDVSPMKHGQGARATPANKGFCKSLIHKGLEDTDDRGWLYPRV